MPGRRRRGLVIAAAALALLWAGAPSGRGCTPATLAPRPADSAGPTARAGPTLERVGALGRIEPGRGVVRVAGPPRPAVVIERLFVEEGDTVRKGQEMATLAGIGVQRAAVVQLRAELGNAERELQRHEKLRLDSVLSESAWQALLLARDVGRARLLGAEAELELSTVRAPIDGEVLDVHAREGERVGPEGIAEVGDTATMYAVAEVYETDIGRVRSGQHARIESAAIGRALDGVVERVGRKIGKQDTLSTDPVADADARVDEVRVRILEPERAAAFTNARVDIVIEP